MKNRSTVCLVIGLGVALCGVAYFIFGITRGGPRYPIDALAILIGLAMFYIFWLLFTPLAIFGVVFGIKGLKENINKSIPCIGISLSIIGLAFFILAMYYPRPTQYMKWKIYGDYYETTLRIEKIIEDITFPKGTKIGFDGKGLKTAKLIKAQKLWGITFPIDTYLDFDKIYNHVSVSLPSPLEIRGIKCSIEMPVVLFEGGKIWYATLAEDHEIQGITFSKGTEVHFKKSGDFDKAVLQSPHIIQGIPCIWDIHLFDNGNLKSAYLAEDSEIQDIFFSEKTHIRFYESGQLQYATLKSDQEIKGVVFTADEPIEFMNLAA